MSSPFTHSLHSLQTDRNRISLLALGLASLLFLGWLMWFLGAPITLYETGQIVQTSSDGVVVALFPRAAQTRLQPGQAVQLQLAGSTDQAAIPATLAEIAQEPSADQITVTLYADLDSPNATALQSGLTGEATVAVEQVSPARLVLRATGYGVDTPAVTVDAAP